MTLNINQIDEATIESNSWPTLMCNIMDYDSFSAPDLMGTAHVRLCDIPLRESFRDEFHWDGMVRV